jgi:hypothetical protein
MRKILFLCLFLTFAVTGCKTTPISTMTPAELKAIQTEEFEATKSEVFAATSSVLQGDGFIVDSANLETGLIAATSPPKSKFVPPLGHGISVLKANAFIEALSTGRTKIKVEFSNLHSVQIRGGRKEEERSIADEKIYQDFFGKLERTLSVKKIIENK